MWIFAAFSSSKDSNYMAFLCFQLYGLYFKRVGIRTVFIIRIVQSLMSDPHDNYNVS